MTETDTSLPIWRRELTPAEHARIRRHIVLIPAYVWLVAGWFMFASELPVFHGPVDKHLARDFIHFYVQGVAANERDAAALYDMGGLTALMRKTVPPIKRNGIDADIRYPPVYGPQVSVLFSPLARLPYATALYVWMIVSLLVYAVCSYAVARTCTRLRGMPGTVALMIFAAPGFQYTLRFDQVSAIGLVCVTLAWFALKAERPFLAGLAIGSLAYKPPLGIAAAFIFIAAREWRIVFGAAVGAIAQIAAGCWFWGVSILPRYVNALRHLPDVRNGMEPYKFHMHSWWAFFDLLGVSARVSLVLYVIMALVTLVVALRCWKSKGPLVLRFSTFLFATILVDPHMYVYDFLLLTPALLLLWDWARDQQSVSIGDLLPRLPFERLQGVRLGDAVQTLVYACAFAPGFSAVPMVARIQPSVIVLSVLGLVLTISARRASIATAVEASQPLPLVLGTR